MTLRLKAGSKPRVRLKLDLRLGAVSYNKDIVGLGADTVQAGNHKNAAKGAGGHLPEYFGNPGNRAGAVDPDQPGQLTGLRTGGFQEKESPGYRAVECRPDYYPGQELDSPVNRRQPLACF